MSGAGSLSSHHTLLHLLMHLRLLLGAFAAVLQAKLLLFGK